MTHLIKWTLFDAATGQLGDVFLSRAAAKREADIRNVEAEGERYSVAVLAVEVIS